MEEMTFHLPKPLLMPELPAQAVTCQSSAFGHQILRVSNVKPYRVKNRYLLADFCGEGVCDLSEVDQKIICLSMVFAKWKVYAASCGCLWFALVFPLQDS